MCVCMATGRMKEDQAKVGSKVFAKGGKKREYIEILDSDDEDKHNIIVTLDRIQSELKLSKVDYKEVFDSLIYLLWQLEQVAEKDGLLLPNPYSEFAEQLDTADRANEELQDKLEDADRKIADMEAQIEAAAHVKAQLDAKVEALQKQLDASMSVQKWLQSFDKVQEAVATLHQVTKDIETVPAFPVLVQLQASEKDAWTHRKAEKNLQEQLAASKQEVQSLKQQLANAQREVDLLKEQLSEPRIAVWIAACSKDADKLATSSKAVMRSWLDILHLDDPGSVLSKLLGVGGTEIDPAPWGTPANRRKWARQVLALLHPDKAPGLAMANTFSQLVTTYLSTDEERVKQSRLPAMLAVLQYKVMTARVMHTTQNSNLKIQLLSTVAMIESMQQHANPLENFK